MYRSQLHCETEVRWHDEFAKVLADLQQSEGPGAGHKQAAADGSVRGDSR
jgi:hypothetical protein